VLVELRWLFRRVILVHGMPIVPRSATGFGYGLSVWVVEWPPAHNRLRFEVYNGSPVNNVDIDFATLHWTDNVP
jgi:hypothetical protein